MSPEEIDHIKAQIDKLNAALDELTKPSTPQEMRHERLGYLFLRFQDGDLPEQSIRRLERRLLTNRDSLRYYVEFVSLMSLLCAYYHPEYAEHALPFAHHS